MKSSSRTPPASPLHSPTAKSVARERKSRSSSEKEMNHTPASPSDSLTRQKNLEEAEEAAVARYPRALFSRALRGVSPEILEVVIMIQAYIFAAFYIVYELFFDLYRRPGSMSSIVHEICASSYIQKHTSESILAPPQAVVSGADGTIGTQIVLLLLRLGFRVCALCGPSSQLREVSSTWPTQERARLRIFVINLEDSLRTRQYLSKLGERVGTVDALFLGSAIMLGDVKTKICDIPRHLWLNVLTQAAIYRHLSAHLSPNARVAALSSVCAYSAELPPREQSSLLTDVAGGHEAYARSKLLLSIFIEQAAKQSSGDDSARLVSLHPGVIASGLYRNANFVVCTVNDSIGKKLYRSPELAAALCIHTAVRDDIKPGHFYRDLEPTMIRPEISNSRRRKIYNEIQRLIDEHLM